MSENTSFKIDNISLFKQKALYWANMFSTFCALDNNEYKDNNYATYEYILAVDAINFLEEKNFDKLEDFKKGKDVFGYLAYDLKNEVEKLSSNNKDNLNMPVLFFFEPRYLLRIKDNKVTVNRNYPEAFHIVDYIENLELPQEYISNNITLDLNVTKDEYLQNVRNIQEHIVEGNVYELNYCVEYFKENIEIKPIELFNVINTKSKAPFSSFLKFKNFYTLSFSPERFLKKEGEKLISQPIKGTIRKSTNPKENAQLKSSLKADIKERAENVMIVDLVRNDLTKSAKTGTIKVEELFEIYEFETINQMISTVVANKKDDISNTDIIKNTFPMGSMTGAPKIRAMEIIEEIEKQKRGIYSGAIGYFSKKDDFDFNVVIRSLVYDTETKYLSLQVGGAITYDSIPEKEWQETKEKVKAIVEEL
jgi:para-aminobenzoate synthetase component 1